MNNTHKIFEDSRISPLEIEMTKSSAEKKVCKIKKKQNSEDKVVKFRCDFPSTQVEVMLARGWTQIVDSENTNWHLWWCDTGDVLRQALDGDQKKLRPYQRVPHFRNHYELTRKNYLYRNLKRYRKALIRAGKIAEARISDVMPVTFELPSDYLMFVEEYHKQQGATWIVKPVARSRGKGIFLFRKLKDLIEWKSREVKSQQSGVPAEIYVVQKYIDNPYLVAGRKFDLRIYVLVTSFHPLKVWLAREGFARLCGQLFDLENIDDNRVHLTNTAIQLKASQTTEGISSIKDENGEWNCKWALNKLRDYLIAYYEVEVVENLMQRIAGVIMASLLAVQPAMMQDRNCFELYGYDILLSDDLRPWLLEINASPALTGTDNEDQRLKSDLVDDVLNVLDFEGCFSGHETRIGGLDLLWDDGPVWTSCPYPGIRTDVISNDLRRLNIFLGAINDRQKQLSLLKSQLIEKRKAGQDYSPMVQYCLK
ncbi:putative tubulin polyglutamylase TTLL9 [Trachymyrmex zeteki]|uniref:Tubulin--tyrosine ligase-like protein 9 n=1 Tax=Mycetomoellerius zeteki TaxID=64791 RepID=A0A151WF07_9HYME|nr:PREDICTED: probable tubulin polyglutamylase TTLL9 [Trachymyrmex zeteki]KYQ46375.1 putative tubulin polyglutamylase TTLL9 [Trachymyrmex zeteki]